jgi:hypothetical protein
MSITPKQCFDRGGGLSGVRLCPVVSQLPGQRNCCFEGSRLGWDDTVADLVPGNFNILVNLWDKKSRP